MLKSNKLIISIVLALIVVIVGVLLYIFLGVVGIDSKRTYDQSESVANNSGTGITVIDDSVTYQTMNGFGASMLVESGCRRMGEL